MKIGAAVLLLASAFAGARAEDMNPIQKVVEMISDLQAKVLKEGAAVQKTYEEFAEFCEDRSRELGFEIKTRTAEAADLKALIEEQTAIAAAMTTKIEELVGKIAKDEKDLKEASAMRNKEQADFEAEEKDLLGAVDTLSRAIGILEKEMGGAGASMLQLQSAKNVEQALAVMIDASMISTADGSKLNSFIQNSQASDDSDSETGAPDPAVYKGQSGGIIEVMQGLYDKAEDQLAQLRQKEAAAIHNFNMLKQSLELSLKTAQKEKAEAEASKTEAEEEKATAQGDLSFTLKDLSADKASLDQLHEDCLTKSTDFEDETNSRGEELKALATAKKIIIEAVSLAQQDEATSFLQLQRQKVSSAAKIQLRDLQVVRAIRGLAHTQKSGALMQLASQVSSIVTFGIHSGDDVFAKVKELITDMIDQLQADAEADASKKAYCDKEQSEAEAKKADKMDEVESLTTSVDAMTARIATLAEQIQQLQKELAQIVNAQQEMDKARKAEKEVFETNKAELEKGIKGIAKALKVLTDYYAKDSAHGSSEGGGQSIISMLEVAESDFTKELTQMTSIEEAAVAEYEKETKANEIDTATKTKDVEHKTKESKALKVSLAEAKQDLSGVKQELDAVLEELAKLKKKCFPLPPESYEERVRRREAEIAGLKNALTILDGEAVLLQTSSRQSAVHRA